MRLSTHAALLPQLASGACLGRRAHVLAEHVTAFTTPRRDAARGRRTFGGGHPDGTSSGARLRFPPTSVTNLPLLRPWRWTGGAPVMGGRRTRFARASRRAHEVAAPPARPALAPPGRAHTC